jgi:hypothetical protein
MHEARRDFVVEGLLEVGPRDDYFTFLDGDFLGRIFSQHAGIEPIEGEYTRLGRARISVEWLEDETTEEDSPSL